MELEYASRKIYASPMKRTYNFFSVSHFAIPLPTVPCNLSPVPCTHTFSAKEKDTETGLSYFGARYYSSDLSIWLSVDPMSDKYPSLSPYVYCANNPIKLVDPNGEEIVLETIYKKDDNGNNTGEIDRYNIRITGKIINSSGKKLDMENVKNDIVNQIESSFSGKTKEGITVTTTADFEVVDSYNDIDNTKDHVFELKDNVTLNKKNVLGKVDDIGGKKAEIRASLFTGVYDKKTHQGGKTAAHEMGHLLGLEHRSADVFFNLMRSPRFGTEVSTKQITKIVNLLKARSYFNTVR